MKGFTVIELMIVIAIVAIISAIAIPGLLESEEAMEKRKQHQSDQTRKSEWCLFVECGDIWEKSKGNDWCWEIITADHLSTDILICLSEEETLRIMAARENHNFSFIQRIDSQDSRNTKLMWRKKKEE